MRLPRRGGVNVGGVDVGGVVGVVGVVFVLVVVVVVVVVVVAAVVVVVVVVVGVVVVVVVVVVVAVVVVVVVVFADTYLACVLYIVLISLVAVASLLVVQASDEAPEGGGEKASGSGGALGSCRIAGADAGGVPAAAEVDEKDEKDKKDAEVDEKDDEKLPLRQDGFPARTFTERNGDLFKTLTMPKADHHLTVLAGLRAAKLRTLHRDEVEGYLLFALAQEVVKEYRSSVWMREPDQAVKEDALRQRCKSKEDVQRTMTSNFRTAMYERFGGTPWMIWYVATGDVDDALVELVNEHITQQVRTKGSREPSTTGPHPNPKLSARNTAKTTGQIVPPRRGVQHMVTDAKKKRKEAKVLETALANMMVHDPQCERRATRNKQTMVEATIENKSPHIAMAIALQ
jgi:hypothetical protein